MIKIGYLKKTLLQSPMGLLRADRLSKVLACTVCIIGKVCCKAYLANARPTSNRLDKDLKKLVPPCHSARIVCAPLCIGGGAIAVADSAM